MRMSGKTMPKNIIMGSGRVTSINAFPIAQGMNFSSDNRPIKSEFFKLSLSFESGNEEKNLSESLMGAAK